METIQLSIEKTIEPLEVSVAKKMVARYQAYRKTLIDKTFGINDTRSIWFTIDGVKTFINNLPEYVTGVRIYLATYPPDSEHYPDQTTVVFIGTVEKNESNGDALETNALFDIDIDLGILGPFNQGKPCPPLCGFSIDPLVEKTMMPIELSIAKEMVTYYNNTRKTLINETLGITDSCSVWVSLDELREFVSNLPENANGIRVYLALHNPNNGQQTSNKTTLVCIGTIEKDYQNIDIMDKNGLFILDNKAMAPWVMGKAS